MIAVMANVIAVINQKGGVGKTTTAINLSYELCKHHGARVLLIDFDPQGNATSGLGIDKTQLAGAELPNGLPTMLDVISGTVALAAAIQPTKFKNLSIAPATPQLADAEVGLANLEQRFSQLKLALQPEQANYDYIIVDCPPALSLLTINVLVACNYTLLPVQAEFYALEGLTQLLETMHAVRQQLNPTLELLGVLVTMMDNRTTLSQQVYQEVLKHFPGKTFSAKIPRNIRLAEAPSHGLPVWAYDRFSKGARAYRAATNELLKRLDGAS